MQTSYNGIPVPTNGEPIGYKDGVYTVPDRPNSRNSSASIPDTRARSLRTAFVSRLASNSRKITETSISLFYGTQRELADLHPIALEER